MSESGIRTENGFGVDTRALDRSARFIRRIRQAVHDYPDASRLLEEGRLSSADTIKPPATIPTSKWNYTFTRMKPEYLDLQVERKPVGSNPKLSEKIWLVYGERPSYEYIRTVEGQPPEIITSMEDEVTARRRVRRFIEDMEAQF